MRVLLRKHSVTVGVAILTAAVVATPPVAAHVTKAVKHTWKHLQPLADARYELKGTPAQWGQIQGIPAGFADGVDNAGGTADDLACTGCVGTTDLADGAVTTAKLADGAVTSSKLACEGNDPADEMVKAGSVCIDRYEASVWSQPNGGTQYGVSFDDYPCNDNGQDCTNIYARSIPGVTPSRFITWFQAQQALANSGKRLPTNAEWQMAVAGTPDSPVCNVDTGAVANTGNTSCVSSWGANDMVGNLWEWVADWDEQADGCSNWPAGYGSDLTCFGDGTPSRFPGALIRGGSFGVGFGGGGTNAGPFAVDASNQPSASGSSLGLADVGFRGAR